MCVCATVVLMVFGVGTALAADCKSSKWELVKKGKSHPLGIVIDSTTPALPPPTLSLEVVQPGLQGGQRLFSYTGVPGGALVGVASLLLMPEVGNRRGR